MVLLNPQAWFCTWNSTASIRYEWLLYKCFDIRTILMLILGEIFHDVEDLEKIHKRLLQLQYIRSFTRQYQIVALVPPILVVWQKYPPFKENQIHLKHICCAKTGILLCLYIQRGKFNYITLYYCFLNTTTSCSFHLTSITWVRGQPGRLSREYFDPILPRYFLQGC